MSNEKKTVMLPMSFQRQAAQLTIDHLKKKFRVSPPKGFQASNIKNLDIHPSDSAYVKRFKKHMYKLSQEAIQHSFTPGGETGSLTKSNPKAGSIPHYAFSTFNPFFGPNSVFSKAGNTSGHQKNLKIILSRLVGLIMETRFGLQAEDFETQSIKGKAYHKRRLSKELGREITEEEFKSRFKEIQVRAAEIMYFKLYFIGVLMNIIDMAFKITPEQVVEHLNILNVGSGMQRGMQTEMFRERKLGILKGRDNHEAYMDLIERILKGIFSDYHLGEAIIKSSKEASQRKF